TRRNCSLSLFSYTTLIDRGQTTLVQEALDALALHLSGIDVALGVDSDVVEVLELARPAADASEVSDDRPVAAADGVDLPIGVIGGEPVGRSMVGPEDRRPGGALTRRATQHRIFAHEGAVLLEHLNAVVAAVGDDHE